MKGIILAGGTGSRLFPVTLAVSKQLLNIYDKPMIYYPLSTLMLSGIKDILIISTPKDTPLYNQLLGDGNRLGINISYCVQKEPKGLSEAFILGSDFIGNDTVCLVLGDNIFYGYGFSARLKNSVKSVSEQGGGVVFGYHVNNPQDFGVVSFDETGMAIDIEEKPKTPKSNYAVVGLYFYDNDVLNIAKNLVPSKRGELEITDVNNEYLKRGKLKVELLGRGMAWLDTGTPSAMLNAANFIEAVQTRQGLFVACIEEIAYREKFINKNQLYKLGEELIQTDYGKYIQNIAKQEGGQ